MLQREDNIYDSNRDRFGEIITHLWDDMWLVAIEDGPEVQLAAYDMQLICPFCPNSEVDSDHRACPKCKEII